MTHKPTFPRKCEGICAAFNQLRLLNKHKSCKLFAPISTFDFFISPHSTIWGIYCGLTSPRRKRQRKGWGEKQNWTRRRARTHTHAREKKNGARNQSHRFVLDHLPPSLFHPLPVNIESSRRKMVQEITMPDHRLLRIFARGCSLPSKVYGF